MRSTTFLRESPCRRAIGSVDWLAVIVDDFISPELSGISGVEFTLNSLAMGWLGGTVGDEETCGHSHRRFQMRKLFW